MAVGGGSVGVLWVNLVTNTGTRGMVNLVRYAYGHTGMYEVRK